jgi:hypothetical protein
MRHALWAWVIVGLAYAVGARERVLVAQRDAGDLKEVGATVYGYESTHSYRDRTKRPSRGGSHGKVRIACPRKGGSAPRCVQGWERLEAGRAAPP